MSKISDELRDYGRRLVSNASPFNCTFGDIRAYQDELADRIDAEMVELPKDADGVPIHISDVVWDVDKGIQLLATSITLYANGVTKVDASCEGCHVHTSPSDFTHTRPDSWERIANELEGLSVDSSDNYYVSTHCSKLADRIRKLAKKEDRQCQ